jgi:threonine/homoserine/homoserine lactone efflux protein
LVTALNPKSISFFVAFLPQFLDFHDDYLSQVMIFEIIFVALAFFNALVYALIAARAHALIDSPLAITVLNRTGAAVLIGAGVVTATSRVARP